jgi:ribosomal RNA-processing protein 17
LASDEDNSKPVVDKKKKTKDLNRQMNKKLLKTKAFKRQTQMVRDKSRKKGKHLRKKK